jgi:hypothetical protein
MQLPWIWTPLPSVESQPHAGLTLQVYLHVSPLLSLCMVCLVARWWPFSSFVQVASPSLELPFFPLHLSASLPADQNQEVGWPKPPPRRLPWLIQFLALWALRVLPCSWSTPTLLCASWAIGISLQHGGTFLLEEPIYCASLCLPECLASCTVGVTSKLIKPKRLSPFV